MIIIKKLENSRWFIWVICSALIILGGLASYIYVSAENENSNLLYNEIKVKHNNIEPVLDDKSIEKALLGTVWTPADLRDALIAFYKTKTSDPKRSAYDYSVASDSQMREVGYFKVKNGEIFVTPTK